MNIEVKIPCGARRGTDSSGLGISSEQRASVEFLPLPPFRDPMSSVIPYRIDFSPDRVLWECFHRLCVIVRSVASVKRRLAHIYICDLVS